MEFTWQELMYMAATIYGEARGEALLGKVAVGHVIVNRVQQGGWWGDTIQTVVLKPYQFSCWNSDDPNHIKCHQVAYEWKVRPEILDDRDVQLCIEAALTALMGREHDRTEGSTHYAVNNLKPSWYDETKIVGAIGGHTFYKGIE